MVQLYGLRIKKRTRIQDHLHELGKLSDKHATIGEEVSDNHTLAVLLQRVKIVIQLCKQLSWRKDMVYL